MIKIPDNLMSRPMLPGGMSDGTEGVTRQFGNQAEHVSAAPNVPNGYGGAVNQAAGAENQAAARASEQVTASALDSIKYIDNLRTAEEDSRSKLMMLEIGKKDSEVQAKLNVDPEYAKKGTAEQQSQYETERDSAIDEIHQS